MKLSEKKALLNLMSENALIITPNNRLSASLIKEYFRSRQEKIIEKPLCMPYTTVMSKAYQKLISIQPKTQHPILITPYLCQKILRTIIQSEPLIHYNEGILHAVTEAWKHCEQWQIDPNHPSFELTNQTRLFQGWWQQLNQELLSKHLIHEHQLVPYLIKSQATLFPNKIVWMCFDDYNPQQVSLQEHLATQGVEQYHYDLPMQPTQITQFSAKDRKEETEQMLLWLKKQLTQNKQHIAVVIPDLQQESRTIQRLFKKHFDPEEYNISLGEPLSHFPLVSHALAVLELPTQFLTQNQVALLLQSPYIGYAKEEFDARSQYLEDSPLIQNPKISLDRLTKNLEHHAPKLAKRLSQLQAYSKSASPEEWIHYFQNQLHILGFPGDYGLNSENYQVALRWNTLFDEFRQLHLLTPKIERHDALKALRELAQSTVFQAQKTHAPIHISGLLEASGCEFDCIWVSGLTDQCLPQKATLSPFIPHSLQRHLLMPHSTPERELKYAQQTLARLQYGSPECVLSYPRLQEDTPNLPCTLITHFPAYSLQPVAEAEPLHLVKISEPYLVPRVATETISGGTALLANQAKCPFKAFATHRLKARAAPKLVDGINPQERGQIIHKIMELLWQQLTTQAQLISLSEEKINELISEAIHKTLQTLNQSHPESFDLVKEIEYIRLKKMVMSCLDWEKQRPAFSVAAVEQSFTIELSGLEFRVRVDRLDDVGDSKWVIDYKSSLPVSKPWNEERPKEPQLLLYALLDEKINTLLFLQLKTGKIKCSGLAEESQNIDGVSSLKKGHTWDHYTARWRDQLNQLATEFQEGHCLPNPSSLSHCQQCDFQNLCRFQTNVQDELLHSNNPA